MSNKRIRELISTLNYHTSLYNRGEEVISDTEWDKMYFELQELERETGIIYADSPTQSISYEVKNALTKVTHNHDMLSLPKTKSVEEVASFIENKEYIGMIKCDGLTCSLKYLNGTLVSAETRGNGIEGEDILHNVRVMSSVPKSIPYKDELILDGEIVCLNSDFLEFVGNYKNPRNFASGSIRLLDANESAKRKLTFIVWEVIKGLEDKDSLTACFSFLNDLGFIVVPHTAASPISLNYQTDIDILKEYKDIPADGIVFKFDSRSYGKSLGKTEHHFNNAIAFKFSDEEYETELVDIEWSAGRTGIFTPVAIFAPVEIDGTVVERASLHSISVMRDLLGQPHRNQFVKVAKMNMIIPQIISSEKNNNSDSPIEIPTICPVCGQALEIIGTDSLNLFCVNKECPAKLLNRLDHFCGKKGLDIKGLSVATLEKLIDKGWLDSSVDIFTLDTHREEWYKMEGFGKKSVEKILSAIQDSTQTTLEKFISSLGIPLVGTSVAKDIVSHFSTYEEFRNSIDNRFDFSIYEGFADSKSSALLEFDYSEADKIINYLTIGKVEEKKESSNELNGLNIAITGSLKLFKNRAEFTDAIENAGGKVSSSVTSKTNYLVNNDNTSSSSKNLSARKLGIPVLTEQEFVENFLKN